MDTKELRKLYREELQETLATVGGKSRKRTFTRMVRAVFEHRGGELIGPDETVLVWSDLHLGHANVIEYQERPFLDVGDMDEEIWRSWERTVQPESVLVLVGDVAMGDAVCEATWERIRRTPGRRRHLVIGNHCCSSLCSVGTSRYLTGLFRRRIAWDDGTIREGSGAGEVAFAKNRCC